MIEVKIKTTENGVIPKYATEGSSGFDLVASQDAVLYPNEPVLVPTGIMVELPDDTEIQIRPRSGLALKKTITVLNAPGTIDADYRGEIAVILINLSNEVRTISKGDRIAQGVLAKVEKAVFKIIENGEELRATERGVSGFGSTGTN
jgi:dUTP pyrophosphatase